MEMKARMTVSWGLGVERENNGSQEHQWLEPLVYTCKANFASGLIRYTHSHTGGVHSGSASSDEALSHPHTDGVHRASAWGNEIL